MIKNFVIKNMWINVKKNYENQNKLNIIIVSNKYNIFVY